MIDGEPYVKVGADAPRPFSITKKTLGSIAVNSDGAKVDNKRIATFDAKSIQNYKSLSIANFVVVPNLWVNAYCDRAALVRVAIDTLSYDANNGILTVPYYLQVYSQNSSATYSLWSATLTCYAFY